MWLTVNIDFDHKNTAITGGGFTKGNNATSYGINRYVGRYVVILHIQAGVVAGETFGRNR